MTNRHDDIHETSQQVATPNPGPTPQKKGKNHLIRPKWLRISLKTLFWLLIVVIAIPVMIYIPPVQTLLKNVAASVVHDKTGMQIDIDRFRLKFPLDVVLDGVTIVEATGDTMVSAKSLIANVKLLPLLKADVQINRLQLLQGYYRMVSPDSSMVMKIRAGNLDVDSKSSFNIADMHLVLNDASLSDADVSLFMDVWKQKQEPRDTTATPFILDARKLKINNMRFAMSMLPTIDTLYMNVDDLLLRDGLINLADNRLKIGYAAIDGGALTYLTPTPEYIASHPAPVDTVNTDPAPPFKIEGDTLKLNNFAATYAMVGAKPQPGFDPSFIQATGVNIELNGFYNEATTVRLPIASIAATERSGLQIISGHGEIDIDSIGLKIKDMQIATPHSALTATADVPFALMEMKPNAQMLAKAKGGIGISDVVAFMPAVRPMLKGLPLSSRLNLDLDAYGTLASINIDRLYAELPGVLRLNAKGYADNALDFKRLKAKVDLDGELTNPALVQKIADLQGFDLPKLKLKGTASVASQTYAADIDMTSTAGDLAAKGKFSMNAESYDADVKINGLNVGTFVPDMGLGRLTATLSAHGAGFNPSLPSMHTNVNLHINSFEYQGHDYEGIDLDAKLLDGTGDIYLVSSDPDADLLFDGEASVDGDLWTFDVKANARNVNLQALGFTPDTNAGHGTVSIRGTANPGSWLYDVDMSVDDFSWTVGEDVYTLPRSVDLKFIAEAESTDCTISSDGINLNFNSTNGLQDVVNKFMAASQELTTQLEEKHLAIDNLQPVLPPFDLKFNATGNGILNQFLAPQQINFDTLALRMANADKLNADLKLMELSKGTLNLDTITMAIKERENLLDYRVHLGNRPGTLDEFADVNISGYIGGKRISMLLTQHNIAGEQGYRLGLTAAMQDSTVSVHFTPLKATIAYMPWTFNTDNYIDYTFGEGLEADLTASSNQSSILVQTTPAEDGVTKLHLKLNNIKVEDFLAMSVFAPPVTASINSDLNVKYNGKWVQGGGSLSVADLYYDRQRIGNFDFNLAAGSDFSGNTGAKVSMLVNGHEALTAEGHIIANPEEGGSPNIFNVKLDKLPVDLANPFLDKKTAVLSGYLNGEMKMTGKLTAPQLNGYVACDSIAAQIPMIGSSLRFADTPITVSNNVLKFNNFKIWGVNDNPLTISGGVDATKLTSVYLDITASANEIQLVGNDKRAKSDLYGKLFLTLNATAKGPLSHFDVGGSLNVLGNTDITYNLNTAAGDISQVTHDDVVKFVNFADTTAVAKADSIAPSIAMRVNAAVTISSGTRVTVNINSGGSNRVELNPSGNLNFSRNFMGDMRMNGTLTLGNGMARYNVPVVGEKKFTFDPASYVQFNGDVLNPTLSIKASDDVRANVTSAGGSSRNVNFDVTLSVTGTLNAPKVMFDLSTTDDLTVQNELQSMTPDQRSNQAMNLLLYGQYTGPASKSSSNFSGNQALYGFLESQLNSWAANNIRGVDLNFGINENQNSVDGQTSTSTSYSYQVSKSLFNNRFKIVIGGNYSTDASADENFAQNLINDISFEYMLKQTNSLSMLVKLFRHTGFESILEGEITEMGVGFVMRRRLGDLKRIFRVRWGKRPVPSTINTVAPGDSTNYLYSPSLPSIEATTNQLPTAEPDSITSPATDK